MTLARVLSLQPHAIRGGPAVLHLSFVEGLTELGHEVHVVIPKRHALLSEYRSVASSVLEMPAMPCVPRSLAPSRLAAYAVETARMVQRIADRAHAVRADVVHTFNEAFPAGAWAARKAGLPSLVHVIGMSIFHPPWVARAYARLLDSLADRIVCCLQTVKRNFVCLGVPAAKLDVVYNSVDPARVRCRAESAAPVARDTRRRVGMVAGMNRRKGHLDFVAAASRVLQVHPDVQFLIVGSTAGDAELLSALREDLRRRKLEHSVVLTGAVERTEPWIAGFDVHCVPSLTEALSIAGLEAMALGRPLVATRVGGNPELVEDGVTGLLCRSADPDDLASKIIRLLDDPREGQRMGTAGRKRVERLFTVAENVARLSDAIERARTVGCGSAGFA